DCRPSRAISTPASALPQMNLRQRELFRRHFSYEFSYVGTSISLTLSNTRLRSDLDPFLEVRPQSGAPRRNAIIVVGPIRNLATLQMNDRDTIYRRRNLSGLSAVEWRCNQSLKRPFQDDAILIDEGRVHR